jgi:3',5'-cyclic AMP phosphodiesterase CpdA
MRILHFSDVHLQQPLARVPLRAWPGRRILGGLNLLLGRGRFFAEAPRKIAALDALRVRERVDFVVSTGDFTALGTAEEIRAAREAIQPLTRAPLGFAAVPGNHDLYTLDPERERRFLAHFGEAVRGDLTADGSAATPFPFARLVGDEVAVVGLNSARPDLQPWRATGRIPAAHLDTLERLLEDPRVSSRFVLVVIHHTPCLEDGRPDRWTHRLIDAPRFLAACARVRRGAILCGHVHRRFAFTRPDRPAVLCAGSATHAGHEGLWILDVDRERARATPGRWDGAAYALEPGAAVPL